MAETAGAGALQIMNDVPLFIQGPALSATSDNPNIVREQQNEPALSEAKESGGLGEGDRPAEATPEPAVDDKPAVEKAADEADTGKPGEETETAEVEGEKPHKRDETPPWVKAIITREKAETARQRAAAVESQRMLAEALETMKRMVPQPVAEPVKATPKRDDFEDPDAYAEAKATFLAEQAVATRMAEFQRQETEKQTKASQQKAEADNQAFIDKAQAKYDDFAERCMTPETPFTVPMFEAAKRSDIGADILYELGGKPNEVRRISTLDPMAQVLEIARLEAKLKAPPPAPVPKPTAAPAPIRPVSGGASAAVVKGPAEMSMAEYEAEVFLPALRKARGVA